LTRCWNFGSDLFDTSTSLLASKSYQNSGIFVVKLISKSTIVCTDSLSKIVFVFPNPPKPLVLGNAFPNLNNSYVYSIASQANHTYLWNATNGNIVSGQGTNAAQVQWLSAGTGKIKVQITNNQNCSSSDSIVVSISNAGIKELQSLSQLELYPNPNNGDFKLKITSSKATETCISLLNMLGKKYGPIPKTLLQVLKKWT